MGRNKQINTNKQETKQKKQHTQKTPGSGTIEFQSW
jgi:hypothetical protein